MIFGLLLIAIIFASYIKGYGAIFITSIIAILVNILLLTRTFWFSIPWWIYLLAIGSILISFAIRNEVSENKKIDGKNLIKNIKEKIDNNK